MAGVLLLAMLQGGASVGALVQAHRSEEAGALPALAVLPGRAGDAGADLLLACCCCCGCLSSTCRRRR